MINGKHVIIKTVLRCTDLIKLLYKFLRISLATDPNETLIKYSSLNRLLKTISTKKII